MPRNQKGINMDREYSVGDPIDEFVVPDFIQTLQDDLAKVRERQSELSDKLYPPSMGRSYKEPEPILRARINQEQAVLDKEESRLQTELAEYAWILPPLAEPPHNTISQAKAKLILKEGTAQGHPLTKEQRGFFGVIASGKTPRIGK